MSINSGIQQIVPDYEKEFKSIKVLTPKGAEALINNTMDIEEMVKEMIYILNDTPIDKLYIEEAGVKLLKKYGIPVFLINASYAIKMGHIKYEGVSNLAMEYDTVLTKTGLEHLIKKIAQTLTGYTTIFDEKSIREIEILLETAQSPDIKYVIERIESFTDLVGRKTYVEEKDENGNPMVNEDGNPVYKEITGAEFFNIYEGDYKNLAIGEYSHAEGYNTQASGKYSHVEGVYTKATKEGAHAEGYSTEASGNYSHAEGKQSQALGENSHAEGQDTTAEGVASHIEGMSSTTLENDPFSDSQKNAEIEEWMKDAGAEASLYPNSYSAAYGPGTHVEGINNLAFGRGSHAEGGNTIAKIDCAHAEGWKTQANENNSHAEGRYTKAEGNASHAEGNHTQAIANYSHAAGVGTITSAEGQTVVGTYNKQDNNALFIVGNGTFNNPSNALVVKKDGKIEGDLGYKIGDIKYSYNDIWADDEKWLKANGKITIRESEYKELFDILGGESKPIYVEGHKYIKSLSNIFVSDGGKLYEWQGESNKYKIYSSHTSFADNNDTTAISTLSKFPEGVCAYKIGNTLFWIGVNPTTNKSCLCYKNYNFNTINYKELPNITILGAYTPQGKDSEGVICVYGEETSISTVRHTKYYLSIFSCNNNNLLIEKTVATSDFLKGSLGTFDLVYLSDDIIIYQAGGNISKILYHKFGTNSLDTWDPSYPVSKNQSIAEIDNYLFIIPYNPYGSYGSYCYMYKKDSKLVFVASGYISEGRDTDIQCHILGLYKDEDDDSYKCIVFYSAEEETSTGGFEYYGAMSGYKFYLDSDNKWVGEKDDDLVGWDKNELYKKCNIPTKLVTSLKNIENQKGMIYLNSKSSFYNNATCFQYTYDETTQNFSAASSLSGTTILPNLTPPSSNTNIQCEAYIKAK